MLRWPGAEFRDRNCGDPIHSVFLESNVLTLSLLLQGFLPHQKVEHLLFIFLSAFSYTNKEEQSGSTNSGLKQNNNI